MKTNAKRHASLKATAISLVMASAVAVTAVIPSGTFANASVDISSNGKYYTDFASFEDEQEYAAELNAQILAESTILLKNKNNALPLKSDQTNLSLFGYRSYNIFTGGIGSGEVKGESKSLTDSLTAAGFNVNPRLSYLYSYQKRVETISTHEAAVNFSQTVEVDPDIVDDAESSFKVYGDAAIFTIGRNGGEADDVMMANVPTHTDKTDHYLQLDDNEKELLKKLKAWRGKYFKSIIILINSGNVVQIPELEDDDDIDAILWMGFPGNDGVMGLGKILNGEISPSGRTDDVWAANFKTDPTWFNMGGSEQFMTSSDSSETFRYNDVYKSDGSKDSGTDNIQYEEGIYVGYRWYETAAVTDATGNAVTDSNPSTTTSVLKSSSVYYSATQDTYEGDDIYYNRSTGVVYPFGYGLSYTTFTQKIVSTTADSIKTKLSTGKLTDTFDVKVEVTNTGAVSGKEVVELYVEQPYTTGGVEKAARVLVGFTKTKELAPGESTTVTVSARVEDVASFDYNNTSTLFETGKGGYMLDAGTYTFKLMSNSHEPAVAASNGSISIGVTLDNSIKFDSAGDPENVFSRGDEYDTLLVTKTYTDPEKDYGVKGDAMTVMSRANFATTFPTAPTVNSQTYSDAILAISSRMLSSVTDSTWDKSTDPWYNVTIPSDWTQGATNDLVLSDLSGKSWNDPDWTKLLNKMSWDDLITVVSNGGFTVPAVDSISREESYADDGPAQLGDDGTAWCCDTNIAATWNTELAELQGIAMGNESIYLGLSGWYGPGANTHRSPFGGRNYEYYSSDGVHAGYIAAAVTRGAASKGTQIFIKHFAINDSESNRETVDTWLSEQAMREVYLKSFELVYTTGNCTGCMSSFNRVGAVPASGNYYLSQRVLRDEWGFDGIVITDAYGGSVCAFAGVMQRAGHTAPLGNYDSVNKIYGTWDATQNCVVDSNGTKWDIQYYWVRMAAKNYLYTQANSNMIKNGLAVSEFSGNEAITVYEGATFSQSVGLTTEELGTSYGEYVITKGELPEGLTLNSLTGEISGVPASEPGSEYQIEVTLTADGCFKSSKTFDISVKDAFSTTGFATVAAGSACTGAVKSDVIKADIKQFWSESPMSSEWHDYGRMAVTYSSDDLPSGLTIADDGTITGTYPAAGTYVFNVDVEVEDKELVLLFEKSVVGQTYTYTYFTRTYTLVVGGTSAGLYSGDRSADFAAPAEEVKTIDLTKGIEFRTNDGNLEWKYVDADSTTWTKAVALSDLNTTSTTDTSTTTKSGCGSVVSVAGVAMTAASVLLAVGAIYLVVRKKEQK